jgi:hypothetical protein
MPLRFEYDWVMSLFLAGLHTVHPAYRMVNAGQVDVL